MLAMSGARWRTRGRSGLTMVELLVAMVILLVGIYAVAKGFPALFRNIDAQRGITEMARLCEGMIERLEDHPSRLPAAVTCHYKPSAGTVDLIHPDSEPVPDDGTTPPAPNSRDDLIEVRREVFRVPGPAGQTGPAVYPLNLGPAAWDAAAQLVYARELVELERLSRDDFQHIGLPLPEGTFYVDDVAPNTGRLYLPTGVGAALVDYCWVDGGGRPHYAYGEYVSAGAPVRATVIAGFAGVVQEGCKATGAVEYNVILGDASDLATAPCVLEENYGATLLFGPSALGKVIQVDYRLRTELDDNLRPRRALMLMEEFTAPTTPPYQADLKFGGIDDEKPLYETALDGTDIADVYLLVIDLQTGDAYTDADTEVSLDMIKGKVTFAWPDPNLMKGHELRVYYRTLDEHFVQVQKAPQYFVEDALADTYQNSDPALDFSELVDYRRYSVSADAGDAAYTVVTFPESAAGQTVAVDYLYDPDADGNPPYQRVWGELHVIGNDEATGTWTIVLSNPNVQAIVGVQGVSLKVRGWWHTERGRLVKLDLDTVLTPRKLL
jgi:prepilin-type N-terminal cleavage/methylation domain-containing protein